MAAGDRRPYRLTVCPWGPSDSGALRSPVLGRNRVSRFKLGLGTLNSSLSLEILLLAYESLLILSQSVNSTEIAHGKMEQIILSFKGQIKHSIRNKRRVVSRGKKKCTLTSTSVKRERSQLDSDSAFKKVLSICTFSLTTLLALLPNIKILSFPKAWKYSH